jgi:hypothetical protein
MRLRRPSQTKGQVTVYIILGIFILVLIGSVITILVSTQVEQIEVEKEKVQQELVEAGQIKLFIESCLEKSTKEGLKEIGLKGGYFDIPPAINYEENSYWFIDQINVQPTLKEIKGRLQKFIEKDMDQCLNYSTFGEQGFVIEASILNSLITFERINTNSFIDYSVKVSKGAYEKEFSQFSIELQVPFRQMFETASEIINLQMETDFKKFHPLEKLNTSVIEVNYFKSEENILTYTIKEKEIRENEEYTLVFASKFGPSYLKKKISLQENNNVVSTILPLILNSIDRMAKLIIAPGTTMNLNGAAVKEITIQQSYPESVTRENVAYIENLDDSVEYNNITWNLTYPLYQFEPSGIRFNRPQRLIIHWDENNLPRTGEMGILYFDETDWRPLPSEANYEENYIYTDLPGWGSPKNAKSGNNLLGSAISGLAIGDPPTDEDTPKITAVDCGKQRYKSASTSAKISPGAGCIAKLLIIIIIIIIIIVLTIVTFGGASPLMAGVPAVAGAGGATAAVGAGGVTVAAGATAATTVTVTTATGVVTTTTLAAGTSIPVVAGSTVAMTAGTTITAGATAATTAAAAAAGTAVASATIMGTTGAFITAAGTVATGFVGTVTAMFTTIAWAGIITAIAGGLVGGMLLNGALAFGAGQDSITFTPTCEQVIEIQMSENGGDGMCTPNGEETVKGGMAVSLSSQMKKCNFARGMFCVDCSVNCKAKYK